MINALVSRIEMLADEFRSLETLVPLIQRSGSQVADSDDGQKVNGKGLIALKAMTQTASGSGRSSAKPSRRFGKDDDGKGEPPHKSGHTKNNNCPLCNHGPCKEKEAETEKDDLRSSALSSHPSTRLKKVAGRIFHFRGKIIKERVGVQNALYFALSSDKPFSKVSLILQDFTEARDSLRDKFFREKYWNELRTIMRGSKQDAEDMMAYLETHRESRSLNLEKNGFSLLMHSAKHNDLAFFKKLITEGANIEAPRDEGTLINYANRWGSTEVFEYLLQLEASKNLSETAFSDILSNFWGLDPRPSPKTVSRHIELILKYCPDIDPTCKKQGGKPPLFMACEQGNYSAVKHLLSNDKVVCWINYPGRDLKNAFDVTKDKAIKNLLLKKGACSFLQGSAPVCPATTRTSAPMRRTTARTSATSRTYYGFGFSFAAGYVAGSSTASGGNDCFGQGSSDFCGGGGGDGGGGCGGCD